MENDFPIIFSSRVTKAALADFLFLLKGNLAEGDFLAKI